MIFSQLFGGPATQSSQSFVDPSQQPFLDTLRSGAISALNNSNATGPFQGQLFARQNQTQQEGINAGRNFALGDGAGSASRAVSASLGNLEAGSNFGQNAQGILNSLSGSGPFDRALAASTGSNADALVSAASRDTVRSLTEGALPRLDRAASNTGNRGSSRVGVQEAILQRGADDRISDISAGVRQDLFDRSLSQENAVNNQRLGANSQLSSAFSQGIQGLGAGNSLAAQNQNLFFTGGDREQANQQGILNEQRELFNLQRDDQFRNLGLANGIIGAPTVLSNQQSTGGSSGILGQALGFASGAAGLFSDINLKEGVERVGTDEGTGLPIYKFSYSDDPLGTEYTGVMAQDLIGTEYERFLDTSGDHLKVDYEGLGITMKIHEIAA